MHTPSSIFVASLALLSTFAVAENRPKFYIPRQVKRLVPHSPQVWTPPAVRRDPSILEKRVVVDPAGIAPPDIRARGTGDPAPAALSTTTTTSADPTDPGTTTTTADPTDPGTPTTTADPTDPTSSTDAPTVTTVYVSNTVIVDQSTTTTVLGDSSTSSTAASAATTTTDPDADPGRTASSPKIVLPLGDPLDPLGDPLDNPDDDPAASTTSSTSTSLVTDTFTSTTTATDAAAATTTDPAAASTTEAPTSLALDLPPVIIPTISLPVDLPPVVTTTTAPVDPPPAAPTTTAPVDPPPVLPTTTAPVDPPPVLPTTTAPVDPPPVLPTTTAPVDPPPVLPTTTAPVDPLAPTTVVQTTPPLATDPLAPTTAVADPGLAAPTTTDPLLGLTTTALGDPAPAVTPPPNPTRATGTSIAPTGTDTMTALVVPVSIAVQPDPAVSGVLTTTGAPIPSNAPQVITPADAAPAQPDSALVQVVFLYPFNYPWVVSHTEVQLQIFYYLQRGIVHGLNVPVSQVQIKELIPLDLQTSKGYVATLAHAYIPAGMIGTMQLGIKTPLSAFYQNDDTSVAQVMGYIDPSFSITPGTIDTGGSQASASGTGAGSAATGSSGSGGGGGSVFTDTQSTQTSGSKASVAAIVIAGVGGAAAYGAAMFFISRRYKMRKQGHRRTSSVQSPHSRRQTVSPAYMTGALAGRGGPASMGANRNSRGSGGSSAKTAQISAPMMSENSLGWN